MNIASYCSVGSRRLLVGVLVTLLLAALAGCTIGGSPEATVSAFFSAINANNPEKAVDYVCGDIVIPQLPPNLLRNMNYKTLTNDGSTARVQVTGEIRATTGLFSGKKELDFQLVVLNNGGRWCIQRDSLQEFLKAIVSIK